MDAIQDFENLLNLFTKHGVAISSSAGWPYLAKPRYTKDIDIWIDPQPENVALANAALSEFGSPALISADQPDEILQIGVAPHRLDILLNLGSLRFARAWGSRIEASDGRTAANWIDIDSLIEIKSGIDHPRHQEDTRVLRQVRDLHLK